MGAIRPAMFTKYLPGYDWDPIVLTVKTKYYEQQDRGSKLIGDQQLTMRTIKLPTIKEIYLSLKAFYLKNMKSVTLAQEQQKWVSPHPSRNSKEGAFTKIHRYINSLFIFLPITGSGWALPAVLMGLYLLKKHEISVVFTTSPPHSVHLIGLILHAVTGIPWVVDFRDPWKIEDESFMTRSRLSDAIENHMKNAVIRKCRAVISVTQEMTEEISKSNGRLNSNKFITLTNGVDLSELSSLMNCEKNATLTITYAGTFYLGRNPELLLRAVSQLLREGLIKSDELQIKFIGNCRFVDGVAIEKTIDEIGVYGIVTVFDQLPHHNGLWKLWPPRMPCYCWHRTSRCRFQQRRLNTWGSVALLSPFVKKELHGISFRIIFVPSLVDPEDLPTMKRTLLDLRQRKEEKVSEDHAAFMDPFDHRQLSAIYLKY